MRLINWFNPRRRHIAVALVGLIVVASFSAGTTAESAGQIRIPDLGPVLAVAIGLAAISGVVFFALVRPERGKRSPGEMRTVRALLILAAVVSITALWIGSNDPVDDVSLTQEEEAPTATDGGSGIGAEGTIPDAEPTDIVALALILLIVGAALIWRKRRSEPTPHETVEQLGLPPELAPVVEEAHHLLSAGNDPRRAVLLAYASLERTLADLDRDRRPSETPSEHMARVLADIPVSVSPAVRLGKLYEIARFSAEAITEDDRLEATQALDRARDSLAGAGLGRA